MDERGKTERRLLDAAELHRARVAAERDGLRLEAEQAHNAICVLLGLTSDDAFVEAVGMLAGLRCIHCGQRLTEARPVCHCQNDE